MHWAQITSGNFYYLLFPYIGRKNRHSIIVSVKRTTSLLSLRVRLYLNALKSVSHINFVSPFMTQKMRIQKVTNVSVSGLIFVKTGVWLWLQVFKISLGV